ncbi:MAG: hypothetical protein U5N86_13390 [Planctomycetota bacterium]|nr:hypothetical protein [Planctomycetota bacterium]
MTGQFEGAIEYTDIAKLHADMAGSELAVAVIFAKSPEPFLRSVMTAKTTVTLDVAAMTAEGTKEFAVNVVFQGGSEPKATPVPDDSCVVFDTYNVENGYQFCIDVLEELQEGLVTAKVSTVDRERKCSDSMEPVKVVAHEGTLKRLARKQGVEKADPDAKRVLNKEKYHPPTGHYGWQDDPNGSIRTLKEAQAALEADDKAKAWELAEEAILTAPDYRTQVCRLAM